MLPAIYIRVIKLILKFVFEKEGAAFTREIRCDDITRNGEVAVNGAMKGCVYKGWELYHYIGTRVLEFGVTKVRMK